MSCVYVDTKVIANQQQLFPRFFRSDNLTVTRTLPNDAHPGHWGHCPPMISSHLKAATIISPILSSDTFANKACHHPLLALKDVGGIVIRHHSCLDNTYSASSSLVLLSSSPWSGLMRNAGPWRRQNVERFMTQVNNRMMIKIMIMMEMTQWN